MNEIEQKLQQKIDDAIIYKTKRKHATIKTFDDLTEYIKDIPDTTIYSNGWTKRDIQNTTDSISRCSQFIIADREKTALSYRCNKPILCRTCANIKKNSIIHKIKPQYDLLVQLAREKKIYLYEACYTQPDTDSIDYERFKQSWKKYQDLRCGEYKKFIGYVSSIEIKPGYGMLWNTEKYHTHAHMIIATSEPIDYEIYDQQRKEILEKKYYPGEIPKEELDKIKIKIRSKFNQDWYDVCQGENAKISPLPAWDKAFMKSRLYETIKYLIKTEDEQADAIINILVASDGKKRVTINGVFQPPKVNKKENTIRDNEQLIDLMTKDYQYENYVEATEPKKQESIKNRFFHTLRYSKDQQIYEHIPQVSTISGLNVMFRETPIYKTMQSELNTNIATKKQHNKFLLMQLQCSDITPEFYIKQKNELTEHYKKNAQTIHRKYYDYYIKLIRAYDINDIIDNDLYLTMEYPTDEELCLNVQHEPIIFEDESTFF